MGGLSSSSRRQLVHGLHLLGERLSSTAMLDTITQDNRAQAALWKICGIAPMTASTLVAEIIDIRRFASEDILACSAGPGRREHSTGQNNRMVPSSLFNHRLKDAFMTAARNLVRIDPDSYLAGSCRNPHQGGVSTLEAHKRVS